jgi:hypothetical protein
MNGGGQNRSEAEIAQLIASNYLGNARATVARAFCPGPCASILYHALNTEHCGAPPLQNP